MKFQSTEISDAARAQTQRCAPLSASRRQAWRDWLALAARLGHAEAQLRYVRAGAPERRDGRPYWAEREEYYGTAQRYLNAQLAAGNTEALTTAASAYDLHSTLGLYAPDALAQVAYLYAYALATGEDAGVFFDRLAKSHGALSPADRAEAERRGLAIYRHCCRP